MRARAFVVAILALALAVANVRPAAAAVSCSFNNDPYTLSFAFDPTSGSAATATITVSFTCTGMTGSTAITIKAAKGNNGTITNREMLETTGAGDLLGYNASLNASYSPIFGNGNSGTADYTTTLTTSNNGQAITFTVYGQIPAAISGGAGDVQAGTYTDSVKFTMTY